MRAEADYQKQIAAEAENQYQKTSTEQKPSATDQKQSTDSHNFTASFLSGCGAFKTRTSNQCQQLLIMTTIATAMRAANVADFYMTKYQSKAQEALGPVMQPFIAAMRRIATAESAPEAAESTLVQRARQRIRRFIFCANRTMWFSACELGVFLAVRRARRAVRRARRAVRRAGPFDGLAGPFDGLARPFLPANSVYFWPQAMFASKQRLTSRSFLGKASQ